MNIRGFSMRMEWSMMKNTFKILRPYGAMNLLNYCRKGLTLPGNGGDKDFAKRTLLYKLF